MQKFYKVLGVFLVVFIIIPYVIFSLGFNKNNYSIVIDYLGFYIHFISPILFFIAYWQAKLKTVKEKLIFVLFGFIIPFGIIYTIAYLDFLKNFHPSF